MKRTRRERLFASERTIQRTTSADVSQLLGILARVTRRIVNDEKSTAIQERK